MDIAICVVPCSTAEVRATDYESGGREFEISPGAPAPTSRRRFTHANNYLIVNRDGLAKRLIKPTSSTSGIRVAGRGRQRPRPRIAKGARSGGRWPKRVAPPQLRRASSVRPGKRSRTCRLHESNSCALSSAVLCAEQVFAHQCAGAAQAALTASRVTPSRPAISPIVRSSRSRSSSTSRWTAKATRSH